ncbi:20S proteasome, regulatory subunit beta type PSMB5/PSMB8/PRE2 [Pseudoloma neurophilia]|uniref:proteasome endopeptidase complex n=1 Tax=Pseudoloma neurophilia TaxID=146866 RepID=A0A0R0LXR2_9MICR|nr:20S proteasome, regulatory subunit beta type PSMB5/PSMB8/PRE2 [Pseudoloma neurophilia]
MFTAHEKTLFCLDDNVQIDKIDNTDIVNMVKPFKGTTTLAFITKDGIVIAVDSRATTGSYIASRTVHKVIKVNKYLLSTMAGGAADCFYWEKRMGTYAKYFELTYGHRLPVKSAVNYLRMCISGRRGLSIGTMVCGWDDDGPNIFYLDDDGTMVQGDHFSVGSGSTIAYSVLENGYNYNMSKEDALELGKTAIFHAMHRDAYSGGSCNLYFMDSQGWEFLGEHDFNVLYDEHLRRKKV